LFSHGISTLRFWPRQDSIISGDILENWTADCTSDIFILIYWKELNNFARTWDKRMNKSHRFRIDGLRVPGIQGLFAPVIVLALLSFPESAFALQVHQAPEGHVAHQLAHVFFATSMVVLAYWLEANRLVEVKGWRLIEIACALFVLWNVVAFKGHWVTEKVSADLFVGDRGSWSRRFLVDLSPWGIPFFLLRFDHFFSVPAMLFLLLGIRALHKEVARESR